MGKNKWQKITDEVVYLLSKKKISVNRAIGILEEARMVILTTTLVNAPSPQKTDTF